MYITFDASRFRWSSRHHASFCAAETSTFSEDFFSFPDGSAAASVAVAGGGARAS
jgi:hypothetical protein